MKKHVTTILLILLFFVGLGLILYPTFSNWWNSFHSSKAINAYSDMVANLDEDQYEEILAAAHDFNASRLTEGTSFSMSPEQKELYPDLLNVGGDGIMGYIEIPSIGVALPIYHGTEERILQVAVGHLDWSSFPIGGESTHSVLTGHRGLPSATLFTDLDKVEVGDQFYLHVLDEILAYEVDQIKVVEPEDSGELEIVEGEDYCTLVTCTPYGINSHRLLVRGTRIELPEENSIIDSDSQMNNQKQEEKGPNCVLMISLVAAFATTVLIVIFVVFKFRVRRGKYENRN